jgi:regulator of sigma E protease
MDNMLVKNNLTKIIFLFLIVLLIIYRDIEAINSMLIFFLVITLLVVAHEAAHYITAKIFKVKIIEAGIGFPPRVIGFNWKKTIYSINLLPIGGFVKLLGEEASEEPDSLSKKSYLQRFIILFSGSFINLLLPIILFSASFMIPHEVEIGSPQITFVHPDSPAYNSGIKQGDIIMSINGREINNVQKAVKLIKMNLGKEIEIKLKRNQETLTIQETPRWAPPSGQGPTGIKIAAQYPFTETVSMNFFEATKEGAVSSLDTFILFRNEIISWFKGTSQPELAGPVGIADITGQVAREGGLSSLLTLTAILSINLGILNLLPLPMLDGGRIFLLLIEIIRRGKKINPEKEALFHLIGFFLFMFLAILITINDLIRII